MSRRARETHGDGWARVGPPRGLPRYHAAREAVGDTAESAARWLCRLARRPAGALAVQPRPGALSEADAERWSWEALAFVTRPGALPGIAPGPVAVKTTDRPAVPVLARAQARLLALLIDLRRGQRTQLATKRWLGELVMTPDGVISGQTLGAALPFEDAFVLRVYDTLTGLAAEHRWLRFCSVCGVPFVTRRGDANTCGVNCRTRAWRKQNPERASKIRHKTYRRQVAKRLGKAEAKVDIQRRARRAP